MHAELISSGKIKLAVYQWNTEQKEKPLLLFVHGYPDNAETWLPIIERLKQDFRIAAYDVRGAGQSDKPWKTSAYQIKYLMQDLQAVIDYVSPNEPVHLIAHDWGSIQSWHGVCDPVLGRRIASYTTISGPCFDHVALWIRGHLKSGGLSRWQKVFSQLSHSWYMAAYQLPGFAPLMWHSGLGARVLKRLDNSHVGGGKQLVQDGNVGAKLYRANVLPRLRKPQRLSTDTPVHLIVPTSDPFATKPLYDELSQWAPNLTRKEVDAQHWVLHSHPQWLAEQISEYVAAQPDG